MNLSELIENRMKELNITKLELSNRMGVSPSTITRYLNGDIKNVKSDKLLAFTDALLLPDNIFTIGIDYDEIPLSSLVMKEYRRNFTIYSDDDSIKFLAAKANERMMLNLHMDEAKNSKNSNSNIPLDIEKLVITPKTILEIERNWYYVYPDFVEVYLDTLDVLYSRWSRVQTDNADITNGEINIYGFDFRDYRFSSNVEAAPIIAKVIKDENDMAEAENYFSEFFFPILSNVPSKLRNSFSDSVISFAQDSLNNFENEDNQDFAPMLTPSQQSMVNKLREYFIELNRAQSQLKFYQRQYCIENIDQFEKMPESEQKRILESLETRDIFRKKR